MHKVLKELVDELKKITIKDAMIAYSTVVSTISLVVVLASPVGSTTDIPTTEAVTTTVSEEETTNTEVETTTVEVETTTVVETTTEELLTYFVDIDSKGRLTEESIRSICVYVGNLYDLQPELLQAIAWVESRYEVRDVSSSNAIGVCQIIEKWHKDKMARIGVTDLYDPYSNVLLCADIVTCLKGYKYGSDINFVLMAYNMGSTGARKPYEAGNISNYAKKVLSKMEELKALYN